MADEFFEQNDLGEFADRVPINADELAAFAGRDVDEMFMRQALRLADMAFAQNEVPIGALIVDNNNITIIGKGYNQRETLHDPTAHAEILAITAAAEALDDWRLEKCTLYVTLEPCPMCAGAILQARIPRVVYGAADPKAGAVDSLYHLLNDSRLNHQVSVRSGVLAGACGIILTEFFKARRAEGKK